MSPMMILPTLALALLQGPHPPAAPAAAQEPDAAAERTLVLPDIEGLTPELHTALLSILEEDARLLDLSKPIDAEGRPITDPKVYEAHLADPDGPLQRYLQAGLERFDLRGTTPPSDRYTAELLRFDAGRRAAEQLLADDPDWDATELFVLLDAPFLSADPLWLSEEADLYHMEAQRQGRLAPLTNAGALGYLLWGSLRLDAYWADEERDKEAFIAELLQRGFEHPLWASLADRALEPPTLAPRDELQESRPGRGASGPLVALRGKVGFTTAHEELLTADLELYELLVRALRMPDPGEIEVELPLPHVEFWLPEMLSRVRTELYPLGASDLMRRSPFLSERKHYWNNVFATYGFIAGRQLVLEELELIMSAEDTHPATPRIDELLLAKESRELTAQEQEELSKLVLERDSDRNDVIQTCLYALATFGAQDHHELLLGTLVSDVPEILSDLHPFVRDRLIQGGWSAMAMVSQPANMQVAREQFDGLRSDLPNQAITSMVTNSALFEYPGFEDFVHEAIHKAPTEPAAQALAHTKWMPAKDLEATQDEFLDKYDDPSTPPREQAAIAGGIVNSMMGRDDPKEAREFLMRLIDDGRFRNLDDPRSIARRLSSHTMARVKALLSPEELAALKAQGKLGEGVL